MPDAQALIKAKRAGQEVHDQKIVAAFEAELETIKAGHPALFAKLVASMAAIVLANPPPVGGS